MIIIHDIRSRIDPVGLNGWSTRLFADAEPGVLEDIGHRIADLPRDRIAGFLNQFVKPAYGTVNRAGQRVAELRFVLPARADEFLAALRAYETNGDAVVAHDRSPSVGINTPMVTAPPAGEQAAGGESREISSLSTFDEAGK